MTDCHPVPAPTHPPAGNLLPPFLFLVTPTISTTNNSTAQGQRAPIPGSGKPPALSPSAPLLLPPAGSPLSSLLRGALALLLRTCSAADPRDNWLHLALGQQVRLECVLRIPSCTRVQAWVQAWAMGTPTPRKTGCAWHVRSKSEQE